MRKQHLCAKSLLKGMFEYNFSGVAQCIFYEDILDMEGVDFINNCIERN